MFKTTFTAFILAGLLIVQAQKPLGASKNKAAAKAVSSKKTTTKPGAKATTGKVVGFDALNEAIFPVPEAARPIDV